MRIDYKTFTFSLEAREILLLPSYKGSTLRGGFGNAFRRVVCVLRKNDCDDCLLKERCIYSQVFETPPPSDTKIMRKYTAAPHPFIIEPPPGRRRGYTPGDEITFGLTLVGRAIDYIPYFIYTFDELGKMGIGKGRGKYELKRVGAYRDTPASESKSAIAVEETIYESSTKTLKSFDRSSLNLEFGMMNSGEPQARPYEPESGILNISFITPTRLVYDGHLTLDLEFHMLIRQLLRRLALLSYFHCGGDPAEIDFRGVIKRAEEVRVKESSLRWYDWERYSARQEARMKMGGFVGEITFEGNFEPFMPLIRAGTVLHVGKGTSFGLGRFIIQDSKFKT